MKIFRIVLLALIAVVIALVTSRRNSSRTLPQSANQPTPTKAQEAIRANSVTARQLSEAKIPMKERIVDLKPDGNYALTGTAMMQVKAMQNVGRSTARAALETELYALRAGDVDLVASVITFDPADEAKVANLLSVVPVDIRNQYRTPESIVAFLFMGGQRMEALGILAETASRDDVVVQQIQFKFFDDPEIRKEAFPFFRDPGGWKNVVPTALIERITRTIKAQPSK